jgi:hypothetical protein
MRVSTQSWGRRLSFVAALSGNVTEELTSANDGLQLENRLLSQLQERIGAVRCNDANNADFSYG